jgi:hypothetical protein
MHPEEIEDEAVIRSLIITQDTLFTAVWNPIGDDSDNDEPPPDSDNDELPPGNGNDNNEIPSPPWGSNQLPPGGSEDITALQARRPLVGGTILQARPPLEGRPDISHILMHLDDYERLPYTEQSRRRFVAGYPDGTFRAGGSMTRAEMIQVFFNISYATHFRATETRFTDVNSNDWFFDAVAYLESLGVIHGFPDGGLRPNDPITNAEFAAMAVNFFNLSNIIEPDLLLEAESHWGANYVNLGFTRGWFEYFGIAETFEPGAPIPRAQAVALLNFYQGRVPCPDAINAFLASAGRSIFPDLQRGHWSFYEVMEAAFTRYYYFNSDGTETWIYMVY